MPAETAPPTQSTRPPSSSPSGTGSANGGGNSTLSDLTASVRRTAGDRPPALVSLSSIILNVVYASKGGAGSQWPGLWRTSGSYIERPADANDHA